MSIVSRLIPRSRKGKVAAITTAIILIPVAAAMAYFLILARGEGEATQKLGSGAAAEVFTITPVFADGLTPGQSEPLDLHIENNTAHETDVKELHFTITTGNEGCKASWFSVSTTNGFWHEVEEGTQTAPTPIPIGTTDAQTAWDSMYTLAFEESDTNQSACEGSPLTVKVTSTP